MHASSLTVVVMLTGMERRFSFVESAHGMEQQRPCDTGEVGNRRSVEKISAHPVRRGNHLGVAPDVLGVGVMIGMLEAERHRHQAQHEAAQPVDRLVQPARAEGGPVTGFMKRREEVDGDNPVEKQRRDHPDRAEGPCKEEPRRAQQREMAAEETAGQGDRAVPSASSEACARGGRRRSRQRRSSCGRRASSCSPRQNLLASTSDSNIRFVYAIGTSGSNPSGDGLRKTGNSRG